MAGGGLKGKQRVKGGSTGSVASATDKPVVGATVRDSGHGRQIAGGGGRSPVTGDVQKHVKTPAPRRKGVSY